MVKSMKPGSVLVDLAVERGGNVEGAKPAKVVVGGVKIVGYTNVPGRVAPRPRPLCARTCFLHRDAGRQGETRRSR
jgi:NAD(P) transhydrogenase subunit alpha